MLESPFVLLGVLVYFVTFILFLMENPVSKQCRPDQMPHYVASDLVLHCLPMTLYRFPCKNGINMTLSYSHEHGVKLVSVF